jgi:hypothetical protein
LVAAHLAQLLPPQSTSVSLPFCTPSAHEPGLQTPELQTLLRQSPATRQVFVAAQAEHEFPPQSTSVSLPF